MLEIKLRLQLVNLLKADVFSSYEAFLPEIQLAGPQMFPFLKDR